jgi:hypothetical protein
VEFCWSSTEEIKYGELDQRGQKGKALYETPAKIVINELNLKQTYHNQRNKV